MKGDRFKELYKERGFNQTSFAKEIGMNRSFLSQVESGAEKLPKKYVKKICAVLNIEEDQLSQIFQNDKKINPFNKEYLEYTIDIVDSITDASDLSKSERLELLDRVYAMVNEFFAKGKTLQELEEELNKLRKENEENEKVKKSLFEFIKKKLTKN